MSGKKEDDIDLDAWSSFLEDDSEVLEKITQEGKEAALEEKIERYKKAKQHFEEAKNEKNPREAASKALHVIRPFREDPWFKEDLPEEFVKEVEEFLEERNNEEAERTRRREKERVQRQQQRESSRRTKSKKPQFIDYISIYESSKNKAMRTMTDILFGYVSRVSHLLHREPEYLEDLIPILGLALENNKENADLDLAYILARTTIVPSLDRIEEFHSWMERNMSSADVWDLIGLTYMLIGKNSSGRTKSKLENKAIKTFEYIIEIFPKYPDAYWRLAFLNLVKGNLNGFKKRVKQVAPLIPRTSNVWNNVHLIISDIDRSTRPGIADFSQLVNEGEMEKAMDLIDQIRFRGESDLVKRAKEIVVEIQQTPRKRSVHLEEPSTDSTSQYSVKHIDENLLADTSLETQLVLMNRSKDDPDSSGNVALLLYNQGKHKEAEKYARKALKLWDSKSLGDSEKLSIATQRQRAVIVLTLAKILHSQKKYKECIPYYKDALTTINPPDESWNEYGIALIKTKQLLEASKAFQEAIKHDPENTITWQNLRNTFEVLKLYDEMTVCQGVLDKTYTISDARRRLGIN